ncbi:hydroxyisourate hydrolase [Salipaludibacillus keqinensis]|uniref:5-hydroxyisourate hydrolase n=1 Tax=Salipaludibacillus keqinensis TaxID=2045207 RepID=A0A323TJK7_9BACI|nr:hydroxyisourate hydrolase [Salipaludibacillus keqinensis]PYZ94750.1 hydroxyisourate hydrolase [Salipaludibacillus keqinensis]
MTGKLTTHVLDTSIGQPAEGLRIELWKFNGITGDYEKLREERTNSDGRLDEPLLDEEMMDTGRYELLFHVAAYFHEMGVEQDEPPFLNVVPVSFGISNKHKHFHVPLLIAPGGYSTYRGS